ncbi:NDR1/HIN1-like 8 [Zea mays]|uniref:RBR-type E3 ubiquitin transferase n=1 Tax=Zea mays TaxID=4577 RepID=A0A1D6HGL5_MAIZE|nr:NDR1/HIN1-like 8 [Zea mays]
MPDLVYCPRCNAACLEDDNDAQCPECFFTFCSLCKERRHVGKDCVTPEEKIRILREKHQKYSLPEKQLLKEQREIDELISVCEALRDSKQCPSCKMAISKTEGCNKMICRNCGKFFCYRCNQAIRGYEHFWDGNCVLFEHQNQVQIYGRLEESDDEEHFDDEDLEETEPELVWGCPCPVCGRWNGKERVPGRSPDLVGWGGTGRARRRPMVMVGGTTGRLSSATPAAELLDTNNHILCMGCRGHYCALCRRRVMKSSEHYGPRGCQQHTDP